MLSEGERAAKRGDRIQVSTRKNLISSGVTARMARKTSSAVAPTMVEWTSQNWDSGTYQSRIVPWLTRRMPCGHQAPAVAMTPPAAKNAGAKPRLGRWKS
jgi:hypothetical protein